MRAQGPSFSHNRAMKSLPIPEGLHSVNCYLVVEGAGQVIEFLQRAFGAIVVGSHVLPNGRIMHAEVRIGDSIVMLGDVPEASKARPSNLTVYPDDVDAAYQRALDAGAKSLREPMNAFYGDRVAGVEDGAGNNWWITAHIEDVSPEELKRRMAAQGQS